MTGGCWGSSAAVALLLACSAEPPSRAPEVVPPLDDTAVRELLGIPDRLGVPYFPDANPPSPSKIELGRRLFYDERLSGNGTQSCGTCHRQRLAFADGKRTPTGSTGQASVRNSPGLQNVAYLATLTWASTSLGDLEAQIPVPIRHCAAGGRVLEGDPFAGDGRQSPLKSGLVRGFAVTDEEVDAVVAFLEALTDPSFVSNPAFSDPSLEADAGAS